MFNSNKKRLDYLSGEAFGNVEYTMKEIDRQFSEYTKLDKNDYKFLFLATALQCIRIYLINEITKKEKAGHDNKKEKKLHDLQKKIYKQLGLEDIGGRDKLYFSSLNHIVTTKGVPYDATRFVDEKAIARMKKKGIDLILDPMTAQEIVDKKVFKGANHRFSTLGHNPYLGMIFGTANIMTNTITTNNKVLIQTSHVIYTGDFKHPHIGALGSTVKMFESVGRRVKTEEGKKALIAAIIKQIIHIGTDLYTPCGIAFPGISLVLSKQNVEKITKYVSFGDAIKLGASGGIAVFINCIISVLHSLLYDERKHNSRELYSVKTRKIIDYANMIAIGSNVIKTAIEGAVGVASKNEKLVAKSLSSLDVAGLLICVKRIAEDGKFQEQVRREFMCSSWKKRLKG